jgi:tRNA A-37 threonylcarbamoyl transferase component Bud32
MRTTLVTEGDRSFKGPGPAVAATEATVAGRSFSTKLFVGGSPVTVKEFRILVTRRLRVVSLVLAGLYTYFVLERWLVGTRYDSSRHPWYAATTSVVVYLNWGFHCAAAWLLWRHPRRVRLGLIEAGLIVLPFLHQCVYEIYPLFVRHVFKDYVATGLHPDISARGHVLSWFALLIGLVVFIPSTWQRSLATVLVFTATAFGLNLAAAAADGVLDQPVIIRHLVEMAVWLAVAAVVGLYNSYRIHVLQTSAESARQLGQYRLVRTLGSGGMGEVYLAEHALLRRPCAIKLIHPERADDEATLARFEREANATAALHHPNAVHIYDYGRAADGTFYCVMEYLPGLTLDELVTRHGVLPPERAVFLLRQLCSVLSSAHSAGLIHRDVKPGNVMVRDYGRQADFVTLLDFGLVFDRTASSPARLTQDGAILGTPAYMSPEQANGLHALGPPADLYALGAVGYFLLTSRPPFDRDTALHTLAAVLTQEPEGIRKIRPEVPADLEHIILRCLAKDPAHRFPSVDALDAALARGCSNSWSHARAEEWWQQRRVLSDRGVDALS